jgi:outer membrane receptor protein involved in Fe transport
MYPYWEYRYVNEAKISENSVGMTFFKPNKFLLEGWIIYRWHEINTVDEQSNIITGSEIPYLPMISSEVKFNWFLFNKHKLQISGKYAGQRYNDVGNLVELKDYFLLNASINLKVTKQFSLRFFGNNLLDQDFEVYHTYIAPGINGGAGIEIKL